MMFQTRIRVQNTLTKTNRLQVKMSVLSVLDSQSCRVQLPLSVLSPRAQHHLCLIDVFDINPQMDTFSSGRLRCSITSYQHRTL